MNICFDTFGCRLNRAEALEDEARSLAKGHHVVSSHAEADLIVIRGCSVTARAQHDCEKLVAHLRENYPGKRVFITGCLPNAKKLDISSLARSGKDLPGTVPVPKRTARAYLKVQDGCSMGCTFCIVPKFRGDPVSVPFGEVMDKAKRFIDAGYHEIVVTGCNLMLYSSEGRRLPELVAALASLSPDCRVRLGSVEPGPLAMEVVRSMAENANVCRFLHLSVQSGSDRILAAMRRPYSAKDVDAVAAEAVNLMPLIGLGCDLIAGFPDETETDFRLTKGLLVRHSFSNVHAFPFSERPGTLAAAMIQSKIPKDIRRSRAKELGAMGEEARRRFARRFVGRDVEVVIENNVPLAGWTGEYIWLEAPRTFGRSMRKETVRFKVRTAHRGMLYGEPIANGR
jgi:threonylcarbamoyladenosine tRNA methylthiotransferase MtaB